MRGKNPLLHFPRRFIGKSNGKDTVRWGTVCVFPVPAPARTSSGPDRALTAAVWAGFRDMWVYYNADMRSTSPVRVR